VNTAKHALVIAPSGAGLGLPPHARVIVVEPVAQLRDRVTRSHAKLG
jgi:hypothetical protein